LCLFLLLASVAPKRKKPRPVKYDDESPIFTVRNSPISSATKAEMDHSAKIETSSPNLEKNTGSAAENGGVLYELASSQGVPPPASSEAAQQPESCTIKPESNVLSDSKVLIVESENKDVGVSKEEPQSPKRESPVLRLDDNRDDGKANKV
jgi:hypothetical protein